MSVLNMPGFEIHGLRVLIEMLGGNNNRLFS